MSIESSFNAALALHGSGSLQEAEQIYRQILNVQPHNCEAAHYLGVLLHQTGRSQEGVELVFAALEQQPEVAARYNDLGNILVELGSLDEAAAVFGMSLALDPNDANAWNNRGSVHQRLGRIADAEADYRSAICIDSAWSPALMNLASLLIEDGREVEGAKYWCQAFVQPPHDDKDAKLLATAYYLLGRHSEAADCYRRCLLENPDDAIARHHLAACTGIDVPSRASEDYIAQKFNELADSFEAKLTKKLDYRGPEIIRELLDGAVPADRAMTTLDGGCGTGLCGSVLTPYARNLVGVDLSSEMTARARELNLYDELVVEELCRYLGRNPERFALIAMADTVNYFGDVAELFAASHRALKRGGFFAFTTEHLEEGQGGDYKFNASGRYAHSLRYIKQMARASGFELLRSSSSDLRHEFGTVVPGLGVLLAKF